MVYEEVTERAEQGEVTASTDELTSVQALERKHPGLPLALARSSGGNLSMCSMGRVPSS